MPWWRMVPWSAVAAVLLNGAVLAMTVFAARPW